MRGCPRDPFRLRRESDFRHAGPKDGNLHWHAPTDGDRLQNFNITYTQGTSDLSITINSLTTSAGSPVTGITIGVGFGTLSGSACVLQITAPAATLGQELFAPNGASAGSYCAQIFDCPSGATGCTPTLPEPVTYSMTVKHY